MSSAVPATLPAGAGHVAFEAMIDRTPDVVFWCLPLTVLPCGRVVLDSFRGEMIGKGTFEELGDTSPGGRTYRLTVDARRYPEVLDVQPRDRLTIDDARVFEVVSIANGDQALVVLDLARA